MSVLDGFKRVLGGTDRTEAASPPSMDLSPETLRSLLEMVNSSSQPTVNALRQALSDIDLAFLSIKAFGYDLARRLADALPPSTVQAPQHIGLQSKTTLQADLESDWDGYWLRELQIPFIYHRKLWELAYVLQAVFEEGHLHPGSRGLGFGCGTEPLPSYFIAKGASVTITDLPAEEAQQRGWAETGQHAASLEKAFHAHLVDRVAFDAGADLRHVDMNAIPADLKDYDFCWSVCALEHLGSIDNGLKFVENSLETIRPGGLAVHTTEFNINPEGPTIDNWPCVLFQQKHMEELAARLTAKGHYVAPLNFALGDKAMDRFIDLPPWAHNMPEELSEFIGPMNHLKIAVDGFMVTCFGLVIRKGA